MRKNDEGLASVSDQSLGAIGDKSSLFSPIGLIDRLEYVAYVTAKAASAGEVRDCAPLRADMLLHP